jgi:hypothetical protein
LSKKGNFDVADEEKWENNRDGTDNGCIIGHCFQGPCQGPVCIPQKGNYLTSSKSEEKQDTNDFTYQGPSNGLLGRWSHDQLPKMVKKPKL